MEDGLDFPSSSSEKWKRLRKWQQACSLADLSVQMCFRDEPHNTSSWRKCVCAVSVNIWLPVVSLSFPSFLLGWGASGSLFFCQVQWCELKHGFTPSRVKFCSRVGLVHDEPAGGEGGSKLHCKGGRMNAFGRDRPWLAVLSVWGV